MLSRKHSFQLSVAIQRSIRIIIRTFAAVQECRSFAFAEALCCVASWTAGGVVRAGMR